MPIPTLSVTFSGLCAIVNDTAGANQDKQVHALLVAASKSKVTPSLCQHDRRLTFDLANLKSFGTGDDSGPKPFWKSFGFDSPSGITTLCSWNIDGCRLEIWPNGEPDPEDLGRIQYRCRDILDLSQLGADAIDPKWLADEAVAERDLVGASFKMRHGFFDDGEPVEQPWIMCNERETCSDREAQTFDSSVVLDMPYSEAEFFRIWAWNYKKQCAQWIDLSNDRSRRNRTVEVSVSNLCPAGPIPVRREPDVLACYELCRTVIEQPRRRIPVKPNDDVTPRQSACPPVSLENGP
ncbi:MAG: hypothetical protein AAGN66_05305 [Acidobacteriota bacterium]